MVPRNTVYLDHQIKTDMNQRTTRHLLTFFFIGLTFWSCRQEPANDTDDLVGYWEIEEAFRNGQLTESLDELYFEFFQDGTMRTNISGVPAEASYELQGEKVLQRESEMDIDYTVQGLTDTTLTLSTTIRDFDFRFVLNKRIPQE